MKKVVFFSVVFALVLCLIDTAIISHIHFFEWHPETVLILVLFVSFNNGSMAGTVAAFFAGLVLDFLSLAPLGLHSATFVIIAFIVGKLHGRYNLNRVLALALLTFIALIVQSLLFFVLRFIFGTNIAVPQFLQLDFWISTVVTVISAPILFAIFNLFPTLLRGDETV